MTDISLVIPTMNEEEGIRECIKKAKTAFSELGVDGEIIISDGSTDRTPEIAKEEGARVVSPDRDGYGYAYRYGFERAKGDLIAMGDGDTTYDFEELPKLVRKLKVEKADMVLGSRLEGEIKPGAMPKLHKYVGNPLLTKFLNLFYDAGVSDSHSGLRVFRREILEELNLETDGMEFASEMIMKAGAKKMKIEEVPIVYHARKGEATLDSFKDGWRHVKFMLVNAPSNIFSIPGSIISVVGLAFLITSFLNLTPFGQKLGPNSMIAGSMLLLTGYQIQTLSVFSSVASDPIKQPKGKFTKFIRRNFSLERGMSVGGTLFLLSIFYSLYLVGAWYQSSFEAVPTAKEGIMAFTGLILGIQTIMYSLFLTLLSESNSDKGRHL